MRVARAGGGVRAVGARRTSGGGPRRSGRGRGVSAGSRVAGGRRGGGSPEELFGAIAGGRLGEGEAALPPMWNVTMRAVEKLRRARAGAHVHVAEGGWRGGRGGDFLLDDPGSGTLRGAKPPD